MDIRRNEYFFLEGKISEKAISVLKAKGWTVHPCLHGWNISHSKYEKYYSIFASESYCTLCDKICNILWGFNDLNARIKIYHRTAANKYYRESIKVMTTITTARKDDSEMAKTTTPTKENKFTKVILEDVYNETIAHLELDDSQLRLLEYLHENEWMSGDDVRVTYVKDATFKRI